MACGLREQKENNGHAFEQKKTTQSGTNTHSVEQAKMQLCTKEEEGEGETRG